MTIFTCKKCQEGMDSWQCILTLPDAALKPNQCPFKSPEVHKPKWTKRVDNS